MSFLLVPVLTSGLLLGLIAFGCLSVKKRPALIALALVVGLSAIAVGQVVAPPQNTMSSPFVR